MLEFLLAALISTICAIYNDYSKKHRYNVASFIWMALAVVLALFSFNK